MEKLLDKFLWDGFGFPIALIGARWKTSSTGYTVLDIDVQSLGEAVCQTLLLHPTILTGQQVIFLRKHFEMTLAEFGKLVKKSHACVKHWEDKGAEATGMDANTELILRLRLAERVGVALLQRVFEEIVIPDCVAKKEFPVEVVSPNAA
jgi:DNA-binding transcriptional regulator YiaG